MVSPVLWPRTPIHRIDPHAGRNGPEGATGRLRGGGFRRGHRPGEERRRDQRGERIWINEALTRAIAPYLARASGRHYETLFCDEADRALDSERKRMFMQMKREVLRLGGYAREYFVSQTPELTQMADVVIDVGALSRSSITSTAHALAYAGRATPSPTATRGPRPASARARGAASDAWWLYVLLCARGRLYVDIAKDVDARFALHCSGKGAFYTRLNVPLRVMARQRHESRSAAIWRPLLRQGSFSLARLYLIDFAGERVLALGVIRSNGRIKGHANVSRLHAEKKRNGVFHPASRDLLTVDGNRACTAGARLAVVVNEIVADDDVTSR